MQEARSGKPSLTYSYNTDPNAVTFLSIREAQNCIQYSISSFITQFLVSQNLCQGKVLY